LLFLLKLTKVFILIRSNKVIKKQNYSLVVLEKKQSAFSFFNYVFINENLLENKDLQIIQHELIHCKHRHTLDLLYFELLKILLWFNPLVYVYQKRITLLHEYISDAEVVRETDKNNYFNKLLSETFNIEDISFINQFFKHSLIKKRIVMITKEKSQKLKQLKYLLIVPLLLGMLALSSFESKSIETFKNPPLNSDNIFKENSNTSKLGLDSAVLTTKDTINETVPFALIEKVPVFPGCEGTEEELKACLQEKITAHVGANFNSGLAKGLGLEAGLSKIFVMFTIDKEGNVKDVKARAAHIKLQEEAIRVIASLPKITPGKQKGEAVGVKYSLPIAFMVEEKNIEKEKATNTDLKEIPLYIIDGVEVSNEELKKLDPSSIESMNVLKDKAAIEKYGEKGKNGVVLITKKQ